MSRIFLDLETPSYKTPKGKSYKETRLLAGVVFVEKNKQALSKKHSGIIDTGAYFSVIPYSIWKNLHVEKWDEKFNVGGLHPGKECQVICELGGVLMQIVDDFGNRSKGFPCWAYLVPKEYEVPLILGFEHCLERFSLTVDISSKKAFLENPA